MAETTYNVGIYCRLSNDDERDGESVSIENQKLLLQQYVHDRGWNEVDVYIDDGFSGTNFQRPGVQRLIEDADYTLYGLANAVTRYSQDVDSYDRASKLEEVGYSIMTMSPELFRRINQFANMNV